MHRELPLTLRALDAAGAIPLLGFNKVGENTFPNLIAMLTGLSQGEATKGCPWPGRDHAIDPCPFVWRQFAAAGFRTVYAEDCPSISTFNYAKVGFRQQPTDYYPRPLLQNIEDEIGHWLLKAVKQCSGSRLSVDTFVDYAKKVAQRFFNSRWFGFFWSNSVSHDLMTTPHIGDDAFSGLISSINLNKTALLVLSDHGMRWGEIMETYQGWVESCLPGAFVVLPPWFEKRFPKAVANLRFNAATRLTTPFDIHTTLLDLIDPEVELPNPGASKIKRGVSLFSEISPERTCDKAGIPGTFCTCQVGRPVPIKSIPNGSAAIVATLNAALQNSSGCAALVLDSVVSARQSGIDLHIAVQVSPGKGRFQSTVREVAVGRFEVQGPIARMNLYGNSSWCVDSFTLKPICYCV